MDFLHLRQAGLDSYYGGDLQEARRLFQVALALEPAASEVMQCLGAVEAGANRCETAARAFSRALRVDAAQPACLFNLGLMLRVAGRDDEALASLRAALERQPAFPEAHFQTGQILQSRQDYAAANRHLAAAAAGDPGLRPLCDELTLFNQTFHTGERADLAPSRQPDPPLVSVVIPCVDYGRFVLEAVESCLRQTYPALEVVVVDGGSTDLHTRNVLRALGHPRVRVVLRSPRRRVGDNRNFGLGLARGDFVCCLDADDLFDPGYIDRAMFALTRLGYDLVGASVRAFGVVEAQRSFMRHPTVADLLRANQFAMGAVFRRELWARSGGFYDMDGDDAIHEDWNFWLRLAAMGAKTFNINWEPLIHCRQHDQPRMSGRRNLLPLDRQTALFRIINADVLPPAGP